MRPHEKPCPVCGKRTLDLDVRLKVHDPPPSLAGQQSKVAGRFYPVLICRSATCEFERWGEFEDDHAVFIVPEDA